MLTTPSGSAALFVLTKALSPAFPSLHLFDRSARSAGRGGLADAGDIPTPRSQEAVPAALACVQPTAGAGALGERGRCG